MASCSNIIFKFKETFNLGSHFYDTRRNDWRRQGNESTTFQEQSDTSVSESGLIRKFESESRITVEILASAAVCALDMLSSSIILLCHFSFIYILFILPFLYGE